MRGITNTPPTVEDITSQCKLGNTDIASLQVFRYGNVVEISFRHDKAYTYDGIYAIYDLPEPVNGIWTRITGYNSNSQAPTAGAWIAKSGETTRLALGTKSAQATLYNGTYICK